MCSNANIKAELGACAEIIIITCFGFSGYSQWAGMVRRLLQLLRHVFPFICAHTTNITLMGHQYHIWLIVVLWAFAAFALFSGSHFVLSVMCVLCYSILSVFHWKQRGRPLVYSAAYVTDEPCHGSEKLQ